MLLKKKPEIIFFFYSNIKKCQTLTSTFKKMTGVSQLYTSVLHMCVCVHTCTHTHIQETLTLSLDRLRSGGNLEFTQVILRICYWRGGGGILRTQNVTRVPTVNHLSCPSLKGQPLPHSAPCGLNWLLGRKPSEKVFSFFSSFFHQSWRSLLGLAAFCLDISKRQGPCGFSQPVNVSCLLALGATPWPVGRVCLGGYWCIRKALRFWGLANTAYKDASFFTTNNHTAFPIRILACEAVDWTLSLFLGVWCEVWFSELWIWGFPYLGC